MNARKRTVTSSCDGWWRERKGPLVEEGKAGENRGLRELRQVKQRGKKASSQEARSRRPDKYTGPPGNFNRFVSAAMVIIQGVKA